MTNLRIIHADVRDGLQQIPERSVQCVVTSPPYWGLRSYLKKDHPDKAREIGQEKTPQDYVNTMLQIFGGKDNPVGIWRCLRDDGTVWLNLGDSYAGSGKSSGQEEMMGGEKQRTNGGSLVTMKTPTGNGLKQKDLCMIPARVALALQAAGWYLRSDIIWAKPNCMPESVTDRPTRSHEYLFLLTKSPRYFYDAEAIKEPASESDWESRLGRANLNNKLLPTDQINGIRVRENHEGKYHPNGKGRAGTPMPTAGAQGTARPTDKQRGHTRRHDGFSDRWDAMEKSEQAEGRPPMNGMRNKRDVWHVSPANYPEAHFATFPTDLIKPCILAGTSAKGACPQCGAPWERQIELGDEIQLGHAASRKSVEVIKEYRGETSIDSSGMASNKTREKKTIGWQPTCSCSGAVSAPMEAGSARAVGHRTPLQPCVVLDPFGGSGTTGEVALELGRAAILIELNDEYLPLIERRTFVTPGLALA